MASVKYRFKKLFSRSGSKDEQNTRQSTTISLRTISGEVRVIQVTTKARKCPTCEFDSSSNVMPIFEEKSSKSKLYTEVLRTANLNGELSCACCTLVQECISTFDPNHKKHLPGHYRGWAGFSKRTLNIGQHVELFAMPNQSFLPFGLITRSKPTGDTSSSAAVKWVQERLSRCAETHGWCGDGSGTILPDRVIDIGSREEDPIVLLETFESPKLGRYIALSHCWGGKLPACRTTKETLTAQLSNIPFHSFPKTFRDAITMARRLEVRFLWIDSVCIVQDDEGDWQRQAANMCNVYSQAYLTLAAVYSPDCAGGLFSNNDEYQTREVGTFTQDDLECKVHARLVPNHYHFWDSGGSDVFANAPPLFRRAWTYQERFLSKRLLWFTPYELQWECEEAVSCECTSQATFLDTKTTRLPPFSESSTGKFAKTLFRTQLELSSEDLWTGVINRYCRLEMTKESDKLPALAGLAQQVSRTRPNSIYLAGMWSDTLAIDILWSCIYGSALGESHAYTPLPAIYRAPSWSWAAVEGHVTIPTPLLKTGKEPVMRPQVMGTIIECTCTYVDNNPFNKVLSGHLKLVGTIHSCYAEIFEENSTWCLRPRTANAPLLRELMADFEWGSASFGIKPGTEIHLLRWAKDQHWIFYIVLLRTNVEIDHFRRIGLLFINHSKESGKRGVGSSEDRLEAQIFGTPSIATVVVI